MPGFVVGISEIGGFDEIGGSGTNATLVAEQIILDGDDTVQLIASFDTIGQSPAVLETVQSVTVSEAVVQSITVLSVAQLFALEG